MSSITSPLAGNGGLAIAAGGQRATSPMTAGFAAAPSGETIAAVQSGVATQYWDECVSYPTGSMASLWLLVDGAWRAHDNPTAATQGSRAARIPGGWECRARLVQRRLDRRARRVGLVASG